MIRLFIIFIICFSTFSQTMIEEKQMNEFKKVSGYLLFASHYTHDQFDFLNENEAKAQDNKTLSSYKAQSATVIAVTGLAALWLMIDDYSLASGAMTALGVTSLGISHSSYSSATKQIDITKKKLESEAFVFLDKSIESAMQIIIITQKQKAQLRDHLKNNLVAQINKGRKTIELNMIDSLITLNIISEKEAQSFEAVYNQIAGYEMENNSVLTVSKATSILKSTLDCLENELQFEKDNNERQLLLNYSKKISNALLKIKALSALE